MSASPKSVEGHILWMPNMPIPEWMKAPAMREPGFYWVRWKDEDGGSWMPAEWSVRSWWWGHGDDLKLQDSDFAEIGPRIYPPAEGHGPER